MKPRGAAVIAGAQKQLLQQVVTDAKRVVAESRDAASAMCRIVRKHENGFHQALEMAGRPEAPDRWLDDLSELVTELTLHLDLLTQLSLCVFEPADPGLYH